MHNFARFAGCMEVDDELCCGGPTAPSMQETPTKRTSQKLLQFMVNLAFPYQNRNCWTKTSPQSLFGRILLFDFNYSIVNSSQSHSISLALNRIVVTVQWPTLPYQPEAALARLT